MTVAHHGNLRQTEVYSPSRATASSPPDWNFCTVVTPLTNLFKGDAKYIWSVDCQHAFENVKSLLYAAPVLTAPRMDEPFKLQDPVAEVG
ncbi:hypothetical protein F2P81_016868 [Scophthalmus maximus]|uniref:Reverse transcriptase/retrotransposon-derived protein RNase H-like domain-containing protein n=1 Tax=Scophthalmus maximus TaxID=52904 RepID=A0A6A4SAB9_SCOMX|nr:hypothetical protein F2P81_016868 [Scophthalmus maximus]